jgi:hypothetical protein
MLTIVAKNVAVSIPLNLAIFSTLIVVYSFRYDRTCVVIVRVVQRTQSIIQRSTFTHAANRTLKQHLKGSASAMEYVSMHSEESYR